MVIVYIILYLLSVVITYYSIKGLDKLASEKKKQKHLWEWKHIFPVMILSIFFPLIGILIVFMSEIEYLIKLPQKPPKWL